MLSVIALLTLNVPSVGQDDWALQQAQAQRERDDWYKQQAQAQKERDDWYAQQAQAQRDYEQAQRDQKERDDWYRQQAQAQAERDEWYKQQAQAQRDREQAERDQKERDEWYKYQEQVSRDYHQSILDHIERVKQQRDEILNKTYDDHPWASAGWTAGAEWKNGGWSFPQSVAPAAKTPLIRRVEIPQLRFEADAVPPEPTAPPKPALPPQPLVILNRFAFQISHQSQDIARPPITPARQEMPPVHPEFSQSIIQNPFVESTP